MISQKSVVSALIFVCLLSSSVCAQSAKAKLKQQQQQMQQQQEALQRRLSEIAGRSSGMPADPQLQTLHREFITKTEKLAVEYERKKQFDKAREAYQSIVRLVPDYPAGNQGLARILNSQSAKDRRIARVQANRDWQDSGVDLIEGMPVKIEVKGTWKVVVECGPDGSEIPKDQRPQNSQIRFGSLIAVVANNSAELAKAKPMRIGAGKEFVAPKSGKLFFRMFDIDPRDNEGRAGCPSAEHFWRLTRAKHVRRVTRVTHVSRHSANVHSPAFDLSVPVFAHCFYKEPSVCGVARNHATGIVDHSVEPFHANLLPHLGGSNGGSRDEVKRGTQLNADRHGQALVVLVNPTLAFGLSKCDQQNVSTGGLDASVLFGLFLFVQLTKRR